MAHIPSSAAIFSPSVARLASSMAKDWNYVDSWLSSKFQGRPPPPFERNAETLKALVALVSLNESSDDKCGLISQTDIAAVRILKDSLNKSSIENTHIKASTKPTQAVPEEALSAIADGLTPEARESLNAMSNVAITLGIAFPEPEMLVRKVLDLRAQLYELQETAARLGCFEGHVEEELFNSTEHLESLNGTDYQPAKDWVKFNTDVHRKIKSESLRLQDSAEDVSRSSVQPELSIQQIQKEELLYFEVLSRKRSLDLKIKSFRGLPPNTELARQQLEALRAELQTTTLRLDVTFEGLVEKETPRKPR